MSRDIAARPRIVGKAAEYDYLDENGHRVFQRVRWTTDAPPPRNKVITYRWRPALWDKMDFSAWFDRKPDNADRYLYHLPDLLKAKEAGDTIWWTEGEKDANRLEEETDIVAAAVSHHGGAGNVHLAQAEWFRGHCGNVHLLYDWDEDGPDGSNPGALDVIRRYDLLIEVGIAPEQIWVFRPRIRKDIYDHLTAGLSLADLVPIQDLTPLRDRAFRTRSAGMAWAGYDPETLALGEALGEHGEGWKPIVQTSPVKGVQQKLRAAGWRVNIPGGSR